MVRAACCCQHASWGGRPGIYWVSFQRLVHGDGDRSARLLWCAAIQHPEGNLLKQKCVDLRREWTWGVERFWKRHCQSLLGWVLYFHHTNTSVLIWHSILTIWDILSFCQDYDCQIVWLFLQCSDSTKNAVQREFFPNFTLNPADSGLLVSDCTFFRGKFRSVPVCCWQVVLVVSCRSWAPHQYKLIMITYSQILPLLKPFSPEENHSLLYQTGIASRTRTS